MRQRGFSLVEMVVVMAILGVLAGLAAIAYNEMSRKQAVNDEIKMLYADIAGARADSMYLRRQRRVELTQKTFRIYSSLIDLDSGVQPMLTKNLRYPILSGTADHVKIDFDVGGLLMGAESASICVNPPSDYGANVDSIVVFTTRTTYGSWDNATGDCKRDGNIILK